MKGRRIEIGEQSRLNKIAALRDWDAAVARARLAGRADLVMRYQFDRAETSWTEIDGRREALLRDLNRGRSSRSEKEIAGAA